MVLSRLITRDASGDEPFFRWASFFAPPGGEPIEPDDPSVVYGSRVPTPAFAPRHHDVFADRPLPQDPESAAAVGGEPITVIMFTSDNGPADPAYDTQRTELAARLAQLRNCTGSGCLAGPNESIRPTVTKKTPVANATAIQATVSPTATFSEPVTGVSGTTLGLTDPSGTVIPAAVTYNTTTRVATLDPPANLGADTRYTATLTGGAPAIRDGAGNALATTTLTFLTGPKPRVTTKTPTSGATGVSLTISVAAKFQEDVSGVGVSTFVLTNAATGATIPAVVSRNGTTYQWILDPTANLARSTV